MWRTDRSSVENLPFRGDLASNFGVFRLQSFSFPLAEVASGHGSTSSPRLSRRHLHAYNRRVNYNDIFFCDEDRLLFLSLLPEAVRRFHWIIHQVTLMKPLPPISVAMD